jgi:hypothetical protein
MTQSDPSTPTRHNGPAAPWLRLVIVLLGIVLGQAVLFGPSLIGQRILLPLAQLGRQRTYLPIVPGYGVTAHSLENGDLIDFQEPERIFAYNEFAAGRFPLWNPHRFGGVPDYILSYSPIWIPTYFIRTPVVLAWVQMLTALVAGLGLYAFCRREISVSFWPAAAVSWCYPLTGAFIVWVGYYLPAVMCCLPWMLLAVGSAVRRPTGLGGPALALLTSVMLVSGAPDIAGQVLLAAGLYALWRFFDHYGFCRWSRSRFLALGLIVLAWSIGIAGSAWLMLPLRQYTNSGIRFQARAAGTEERPPVGLVELPQVVLPAIYGAFLSDSWRIVAQAVPESSVGAYAGLLATLLVAPLALISRRHRALTIFLLALLILSVSWVLNLPGFVQLLRLPVLNMMSHNRLVFVAPLAILSLSAVGLELLIHGQIPRRWWFDGFVFLLIFVGGWCGYRVFRLPREITEDLPQAVASGNIYIHIQSQAAVAAVQYWFRSHFVVAGVLALLGVAGWYWIRSFGRVPVLAIAVLVLLMWGELLYFGYERTGQDDPALYYPRLTVLDRIRDGPPGRIMGFANFRPNLAQAVGLHDIRGYDGVDPKRMVELVNQGSHLVSGPGPALTQSNQPLIFVRGNVMRVSPILSMLNVRYILFRMPLPSPLKAEFSGDDYWVFVNKETSPRAFVPQHVEVAADPQDRLKKLARPEFAPSHVAYVEQPVTLPESISGTAAIGRELPTEITVDATMQTPGLLVLADNWDPGWSAYVNGSPTPVLHVNHAVRGVLLPAGASRVEFRYQPASLRLGLWISCAAALLLAGWTAAVRWRRRANTSARPFVTMPEVVSRPSKAALIQP